MVKLKEGKLKYAFKQKKEGVKNKYLAYHVGVGIRRFQQLYADYKMTGEIPKLKKDRRPKTKLTNEDKELIDRDYNSAKNILRLGMSLCGDETPTPMEQVLSEKQKAITSIEVRL